MLLSHSFYLFHWEFQPLFVVYYRKLHKCNAGAESSTNTTLTKTVNCETLSLITETVYFLEETGTNWNASSRTHYFFSIFKLARAGFQWICAQNQVINITANNSSVEINNECEKTVLLIKRKKKKKKTENRTNKETNRNIFFNSPVEWETEPKPGSSLLWAHWPGDAVVPSACRRQPEWTVPSTGNCEGAKK